MRPALVRVPGVGAVDLIGGTLREVEIEIHPDQLAPLHLTPSQLAAKIEQSDRVVAAGRVLDQHQTLPVVLDAQAQDLDQLRALPIANGPEGPIRLSAVADVVEGAEDPSVIVRGPRGEAVAIAVARLPGASTLDVVDGVIAQIRGLQRSRALPADVELRPVYDHAELVDESLTSVRDAILIGIALSLAESCAMSLARYAGLSKKMTLHCPKNKLKKSIQGSIVSGRKNSSSYCLTSR